MSRTTRRISLDQWRRIGADLFGPDERNWAFKCVQCGHVQSGASVVERTPALAGTVSPWINFSCEGREVRGVGCDWTLGGLFRIHRLEVFADGKYVPTFEFADDRAAQLIEAAAAEFAAAGESA